MFGDSSDDTTNRRRVLRGLGAGLTAATVPTVGTAAAREKDGVAAEDVGVGKAIKKLTSNGKQQQALNLLEKHDIEYTANVGKMPPTGTDATVSDGVTTQDQWTKSASDFDHYAYLLSGDSDSGIYAASTYWDLNKEGNFETAGPNDGVGITVNPDLWEVVLDSWDFDDKSSLAKRGSKGVIVKYNDPSLNDYDYVDTTGNLYAEFEKTEPGSHNIYGTYTHTWAPGGIPSGVSFSLAVGPIGVSISGGTDTWSKRSDNNR